MRTAYCFDLDGTVTATEILPAVASEVGIAEEMATLTRVTMEGFISFEDSLRMRCLMLGQVPVERVHTIVADIPLNPHIEAFILERPDDCFLVTGNLDIWIRPLAERLKCRTYASTARISGGRLRLDRVLDKGLAISEIRSKHRHERIVAIGDGANDVPMLLDAEVAVAFGGVHSPTLSAVKAADYVVHEGEALCALLKGL